MKKLAVGDTTVLMGGGDALPRHLSLILRKLFDRGYKALLQQYPSF